MKRAALMMVLTWGCKRAEPVVIAAAGFEGEIDLTTYLGTPHPMHLTIKGAKARLDDPATPEIVIVADGQANETLTLFPTRQMVKTGTLNAPVRTNPTPRIMKTGARATVAGHAMEITRIEKKSEPDDLFRAPDGWTH